MRKTERQEQPEQYLLTPLVCGTLPHLKRHFTLTHNALQRAVMH